MPTHEEIEDEIEENLRGFNQGPTNGTLNDKRRMALIYEELLIIKAMLRDLSNS